MMNTFDEIAFPALCDQLGVMDADLQRIMERFGYPPFWSRSNSFESFVHIILEQQVSLASALATLNQLKKRIGTITPENLLSLTDEDLKACFFSRQKIIYTRGLATAIVSGTINLGDLAKKSNEDVRHALIKLKGVGNWTIDVYLMFVLHRTDIFPIGDLAARNALKHLKLLPSESSPEMLTEIAKAWEPYRSVATMMLWHYYLSLRTKK